MVDVLSEESAAELLMDPDTPKNMPSVEEKVSVRLTRLERVVFGV